VYCCSCSNPVWPRVEEEESSDCQRWSRLVHGLRSPIVDGGQTVGSLVATNLGELRRLVAFIITGVALAAAVRLMFLLMRRRSNGPG